MSELDPLAPERPRLFALAYRMLGSVADAEDVLQDAALRLRDAGPIDSRPAWLTTTVTRLALDRLKSAARQRETYVGPWLPEPLTADLEGPPVPDERIGIAESVSMAFLVLLERLSPLERAAFLLHEVFDFSFAEVGRILERKEATVRQLHHRAKAHLAAGRSRFEVPDETHARLTSAFLEAVTSGELGRLEALLAEDAVAISDGGGKAQAARLPVHGRDRVARFLLGMAKRMHPETRVEARSVNGQPGFILRSPVATSVVVLEIAEGRVRSIYVQANPDKVRALV